ncbi:uncharacterized protein MONOS_14242 [Monocercomonoides exilis]|uniref:uncharacterized protein n=1 Tax=Monocercomonoides exilis TaxID=2049356 RepID=UPI0035595F38|nr:hypothetical protein MONOS_14242 [Monocercomonoides exilis]|eukprot:MONOS_14242.1-p1 / transcript=MONOS_14242.1 / gene=MONOS_14242 / organism=Monocercomonoides_exilis_PA203 / gene_product=unspecified product / transcript_product=unspecified product / location=Mono_scaffold00961:16443-18525(+) / protein_length=475 / sequence_SO=supercontig / SO=protein_coding / is_pseudo=false
MSQWQKWHCSADRTKYSSSSAFKTSPSHASKPIRAPTFSSQQIQNLCGISNSSPNTGAYAAVSATTALPLSVLLSSPTICQSALFPLLSPLTKDIELLITPILSFASQQKESRADKTVKQHGMNTTNSCQLPSQLLGSAGWMLSRDRIRKISEADSATQSSLIQMMMDEGSIASGRQKISICWPMQSIRSVSTHIPQGDAFFGTEEAGGVKQCFGLSTNSAFNAYHSIYHLHLHPPLVDFGRPFVVEQLNSFAKPRQQVTVKASLERCGQSMEAHITALHQRGHVFSMARRCAFRMASAASTDGRVASAGMSAAAVVSFMQTLSEILEGVAAGGMNVAHGSAPKACSSASLPISKAAFNKDEDEDGDTLLGDKASSDEGRLSVPASTRSSLSISSTSPLRSSSSSASISPLSNSTNSHAWQMVVGGAKERLAITSGSGSSSTSEATAVMRGDKRDDGKSSDYGDDDEDDESADD